MRVLVRVPLASIVETAWPESRPGVLDLARAEPMLQEGALNRIADDLEIYENDRRLDAPRVVAARASLPSDRSFESYDQALATHGPAAARRDGTGDRARVARRVLRVPDSVGPVGLLGSSQFRAPRRDGADHRAFSAARRGRTALLAPQRSRASWRSIPTWLEVAWLFVRDGFRHILNGADHLLFCSCSIIPFRRTCARSPRSSRRSPSPIRSRSSRRRTA